MVENKNQSQGLQKSERLNLYWLCKETGRKHPAGVAFYNDEQSDYRLKVDVMPEDKVFYLKVASTSEDTTFYRVEAAVRKAGRVIHRAEIGSGYSKQSDPSCVYMDIGPFSRMLVLEIAV